MKIHESTRADGGFEPVFLDWEDDALVVVRGSDRTALPAGTLGKVMERFGKPLDPDAAVVDVDVLPLASGSRLRHVRHLALYDVIARDYLVLEAPPSEPLCALATTVAGALEHLASRLG